MDHTGPTCRRDGSAETVGSRHMHQAQSHLWLLFKTEAGVLQKALVNALYGKELAWSSTQSH